MKPKIFTLFTALTLSAGALFASTTAVDGIYYDFDDANLTATVTYRGSSPTEYTGEYTGDVVIPATVTYGGKSYSVTSIGNYAFYACSGLTSVTIPNSVTSIGGYAFYYCSGLTSVTIPNSVTSIGEDAFSNCSSLTSVTIGNSVTSIGYDAFRNCSGLTSVTIPNSVTSIGGWAFDGCSGLTSVTIPNSVTSIGYDAFSSVLNIVYSGTATGSPWGARSVNGYVEGYLLYDSEAKTQLLACFSAATGEIIIPNSVTSIGEEAFRNCSGLTSVTIPNSVTSIGNGAFEECSGLTKTNYTGDIAGWCGIKFGDIFSQPLFYSNNLFINDVEVKDLVIPDGVTSIGELTFVYCSGLTSITIGNSVTRIGWGAFAYCSGLTSVTIPNSVTSIGDEAFYGCSGLTSVVWNAKNCADFQWYYNNGNSYSDAPFYYIASQITSFTFGSEVEHIPAYLCYEMENLTSVTIPNSVTSIGSSAFRGCSGLTSVTIPNSVTSIGKDAFKYCSGLTSVVWNAKNCADFSSSEEAPFYNIKSQITSFTFGSEVEHIPASLCYEMENLTSVTIPNSVTSIGKYAFCACSGLTSVTIGNSVTSIGEGAFYGCIDLTSVTIGNSVTSIGKEAFWRCRGLTSVVWNAKNCADFSSVLFDNAEQITSFTFGGEVEHIPAYLCYYMKNLTSITIPNSVTSIGDYAFNECSGLTSVTIPNSVTSIGGDAFWNCSGLTSVTIGNSVTSIGNFAFKDCSGLTKTNYTGDIAGWCGINFGNYSANPTAYSHNLYINGVEVKDVVIPNGVTSIGSYAFDGCSGLTLVTIPNSVTSIGRSAFYGCSGLTSVTIGNSVTSIGDEAFSGCTKLINIVCYAAEQPSCDASVFANYNAYLKVPCSSLDAYKADAVWGDFKNISCIGSEEVQVTAFSVTPSTNEALFTWPAEPNAATYELVISKDGVVFCTLTYGAQNEMYIVDFGKGL